MADILGPLPAIPAAGGFNIGDILAAIGQGITDAPAAAAKQNELLYKQQQMKLEPYKDMIGALSLAMQNAPLGQAAGLQAQLSKAISDYTKALGAGPEQVQPGLQGMFPGLYPAQAKAPVAPTASVQLAPPGAAPTSALVPKDFGEWLTKQGIDPATITAAQAKTYEAQFEKQQARADTSDRASMGHIMQLALNPNIGPAGAQVAVSIINKDRIAHGLAPLDETEVRDILTQATERVTAKVQKAMDTDRAALVKLVGTTQSPSVIQSEVDRYNKRKHATEEKLGVSLGPDEDATVWQKRADTSFTAEKAARERTRIDELLKKDAQTIAQGWERIGISREHLQIEKDLKPFRMAALQARAKGGNAMQKARDSAAPKLASANGELDFARKEYAAALKAAGGNVHAPQLKKYADKLYTAAMKVRGYTDMIQYLDQQLKGAAPGGAGAPGAAGGAPLVPDTTEPDVESPEEEP